MPVTGDVHEVWSYVDEMWVAYQKDINEHMAKGNDMECPVCKKYCDEEGAVVDVYREEKALHGTCSGCKAHMVIIVDAERVEGSI